jgi:hypothetical protein
MQNISLHIKNVFNEGELDRNSTVREYLTVQKEGKRTIKRKVEYYALDVIISIGYRVKSQRGTQFRIWANKILKDYLVKGYAIHEKRLQEQKEQLEQLKRTVRLMGNVMETQSLSSGEAAGLLKVITDYTYALDTLDKYDHHALAIEKTTRRELCYDWAIQMNNKFKQLIGDGNYKPLINYESMGKEAMLAIPTPEHYLPLMYTLGLKGSKDAVSFFNDKAVAGSLTMTSVRIG